jgi:ion channel
VSGLVALQLVLGAFVSLLQGWRLGDALYFTFVTALTIGYGDLVPKGFLARLLAMVIGFTGILMTGLVAAVGVRALQLATDEPVGSAQGAHPATPHPPRQVPQGEPLADGVVEPQVARGDDLAGSAG